MIIKGIDDEKCIKCLECVKECPEGLFIKPPTKIGEKRRVVFEDPNNGCIECGHCIAVCPTSAVIFEADDEVLEFEEKIEPKEIIDYENLMKFIRVRRSVRRFKDQEIPKEEIDSILKAIRYAPSARNARSWKYVVLQDEEKIDMVRQSVINMLALLKKLIKYNKILKYFVPKRIRNLITDPKTKVSMEDFFERVGRGEDPVFYRAPLIIITYAGETGDLTSNDAGIALTHGMFAAQSRGLGTTWIGYAQEALNRDDGLKEKLNISKEMNINGVIILGYPDVEYQRAPPREPLDVKYF